MFLQLELGVEGRADEEGAHSSQNWQPRKIRCLRAAFLLHAHSQFSPPGRRLWDCISRHSWGEVPEDALGRKVNAP